ncbi:succinylglutamate desuccinylase/aspartoacylase family protein [Rubritalea tangerina]|uniref:Succinylglutamate desuccinylase/aspartoacylase family protein n=1 Tax=Rubritalea tangerina TaxID=430798 RepID=A0ABW4ZFN6_9BACT
MDRRKQESYEIHGHKVAPGTQEVVRLPVGVFRNHAQVELDVAVAHGRKPGPTVLLTACVHGDEINGVETIRRVLRASALKSLKGTVLAVPIVNVPAFLNRSRYLPDRRDLNRLFPGSAKGSLGARLANVLCDSLVARADLVIDLHTGALNRPNLPQLRVTARDEASMRLAKVFGAALTIVSPSREGSFRGHCFQQNKPILLFEGGEALRLEAQSIRTAYRGIFSVMRELGMLARRSRPEKFIGNMILSEKSYWIRAEVGGLFTPLVPLGAMIESGAEVGFIADPMGGVERKVVAPRQGMLIGRTNEGIADEGDALFHVALLSDMEDAQGKYEENLLGDAHPDEEHAVHYQQVDAR